MINAVLALGLQPVVGWISPAIGATVAGWGMVVLLWRGTAPMGESARFDARFRRRMGRILVAALVMGAVLYGTAILMAPLLTAAYWRYLALLGLIVLGAVVYFGVAQVIGAVRLGDLKRSVRRGGKA